MFLAGHRLSIQFSALLEPSIVDGVFWTCTPFGVSNSFGGSFCLILQFFPGHCSDCILSLSCHFWLIFQQVTVSLFDITLLIHSTQYWPFIQLTLAWFRRQGKCLGMFSAGLQWFWIQLSWFLTILSVIWIVIVLYLEVFLYSIFPGHCSDGAFPLSCHFDYCSSVFDITWSYSQCLILTLQLRKHDSEDRTCAWACFQRGCNGFGSSSAVFLPCPLYVLSLFYIWRCLYTAVNIFVCTVYIKVLALQKLFLSTSLIISWYYTA